MLKNYLHFVSLRILFLLLNFFILIFLNLEKYFLSKNAMKKRKVMGKHVQKLIQRWGMEAYMSLQR